ncbi:MAG TPA: O-antigen ligase family protein [Chryseolinea sp.]
MRGNRSILFLFSVLINIRLLTELPRALTLMGLANFGDADFNRAASTLLLLYCVTILCIKRRIISPRLLNQVIALVICFFLASTGIALNTFMTLGMPISGIFVVLMRFLIEIVLVAFVLNFIVTPQDLQDIFNFVFKTSLAVFVLLSVFQITTSSYSTTQSVDRIQGPFGSPTTLAVFLHLFIALTFYYYEGRRSIMFWILIAVQFVLLIYTGSIAIIAASFLFLCLVGRKQHWMRLKVFYWTAPFVAVAAVGGIVWKWDSIVKRLSIILNLQDFKLSEGSSLKWRFDAWATYLSLLEDSYVKWIFGLGVGAQRFILNPAYPNSLWRKFDAPGAHNDYLGVLIDFGVLGLILFLGGLYLLFRLIRKAEQGHQKLYYLRFYLVTVLLIMLTENYIDQLIMFTFLIFLTAIIRVNTAMAADNSGG